MPYHNVHGNVVFSDVLEEQPVVSLVHEADGNVFAVEHPLHIAFCVERAWQRTADWLHERRNDSWLAQTVLNGICFLRWELLPAICRYWRELPFRIVSVPVDFQGGDAELQEGIEEGLLG